MTIEIESFGEHSIKIGGHIFGLKSLYGIEPESFVEYYEHLIDNYSLNLNILEFEEEIHSENGTKKVIIRPIQEYVSYIIFTNILEKKGFDITNLIRQIKRGKDYYEIRHARALTELIYIYHKNGYEIKLLSKNSDFLINGINADIKVAQPSILKKYRKNIKLNNEGGLDIPNEILLDILQMIKSRFLKGVKQADLLFFNLTGSTIFSSLDILIDEFDRIIPPKKYRLILYSDSFYPHGSEVYHTLGSKNKYLGKRTYPDLISFKGYPLDFDPYLWNFLSQFKIP